MALKRLNTGVYCPTDEFEDVKKLAAQAQLTLPCDVTGAIPYPTGAWCEVATVVQAAALKVGLPDIEGFYGLDEEGQFVTYSDVPDFEEENKSELDEK